jgi:predicted outer membrane repeat protein
MTRAVPLTCLVLLLLSASAFPRTWYVKPDSTGDVPTIGAAVDSAAAQGDTVLLADGTFTGEGNHEVDCLDKALTIISESRDPELCIIDCEGPLGCARLLAAFWFRASEYGSARLEGVTITNACGGVACDENSAPEIVNCIFSDNWCMACEVGPKGAGMRCLANSEPLIMDCTFISNYADGGGGLYCTNSSPTLVRVAFIDNGGSGGGGMLSEDGGSPHLSDCLFSGNGCGSLFGSRAGGGGLRCDGSPELVNCTFVDNRSSDYPGGGLCYSPHSGSDLLSLTGCTFINNRIEAYGWEGGGGGLAVWNWGSPYVPTLAIANCTFFGNGTYESSFAGGALAIIGSANTTLYNTVIALNDSGGAIYCEEPYAPTLTCCDIYGNVGGDWVGGIADQYGLSGNFSADPRFCDVSNGDVSLEACSPCVEGNHPEGYSCGADIGALGIGCECSTTTEPTTWGAVKAMYR